jgi:cell division protein FtsQ
MEIAIVPRSGGFIVDMGFAENLVAKLGTLRYFYDRALSNVGWDKYKHISLRYNDQVVCR